MTLCLSQAATIPITIVLARNMDDLCTLLLVGATFSSDVLTLRERYPSNLQLELEGLQEKISKTVQSLMEENSSCLELRRLVVENWAGMKSQSRLSLTQQGFISFKSILKKIH